MASSSSRVGSGLWTQLSVLLLWVSQLVASAETNSSFDGFDFVDPLIGTVNGGHVFAGATLPFGMAKAVADTNSANDKQGGFASDNSSITGFSHMHDSGTGGGASLGNFPLFPQAGCPNNDLDLCTWTKTDRAVPRVDGTAEAHPGYFAISLASGIHAEMTVTRRTALYRFTFDSSNSSSQGINSTALDPVILMDLTDLHDSRSTSTIKVDDNGRITANGTFTPSFGVGTYTLFACADFKGSVKDTGVWINNRAGTSPKQLQTQEDGVNDDPPLPAGAFVTFDAGESSILARVGLSFISPDQACANGEEEIPNFDFEGTLATAEDVWREKLGVVEVVPGGVNASLQTVFWSGLYRSMISPQNYTGENPLWKSDEPYFDSYYCMWDSFRSIHPLFNILDPAAQAQMLRTLLDVYVHEGKLPDCRMSLCKGLTQGGSNADNILVDAYLKNITGGVDWDLAYEAIVSDAEDEPLNWSIEGRGGLKSWKELGYIPTDDFDPFGVGPFTRSISRTVEYAYNDFCISEMADKMGKSADHEKYLQRSTNWKNMFKDDQTSSINGVDTGFTGFLMPRFLNKTWGFQDPIFCSPLLNFTSCFLNPDGHETYEGSSWLYTFFVPQDMATLVTALGGPSTFVQRLEFFHDSGLLYIGDEQAFLMVFLYHYAGRPALSSKRSHFYIPSQFNDTIVGIPGNDDSGAMGSFAALTMMGLFPNPGQDVYFIMPPFFEELSIMNGDTGKKATIRNINFDAGYENIFIQSATLNNQTYTRNWLSHSFFLEGGVLELTLGKNESAWGTRKEDLPPSLSPESS